MNRQHYRIRTRLVGYRRWKVAPENFKNFCSAAEALARIMAKDRNGLKRGEVLLDSDWFDSTPILEMVRR